MMTTLRAILVHVLLTVTLADATEAAGRYAEVVADLEARVRVELERGTIVGLSAALVVDQELVWAGGFGLADREGRVPASAGTCYRVGSVSKLFTALGIMSLSERGLLDIDEPIVRYDPKFRIGPGRFPDAKPTTLRQLLSHRSGFPRESPVGSYFDDTEPGLEATVRSLGTCELALAPETETKYSNVGVALAGHIAALVAGKPFEDLMDDLLLRPLGMTRSSFRRTSEVEQHLAVGYMRLASGKEIVAPRFQLGTAPAGNLYSSAEDLARFLEFIFRDGRTGDSVVVRPETLRGMFRVQPPGTERRTGFGLGFWVGDLDGTEWVGHAGAVYGFSTQVAFLPREKIGVVVCANRDVVNGIAGGIARRALLAMLGVRRGIAIPPRPTVASRPSEEFRALAGSYRGEDGWIDVVLEGDRLGADFMGQALDLRPAENGTFLAYGGSLYEAPLFFTAGATALSLSGRRYPRVDPSSLPVASPAWGGLVGFYGPDFIPAIIEVRQGRLLALVENAFAYEMVPEGVDSFLFPPGLYEKERLTFERDDRGTVTGLRIGPVAFRRRR